MQGKTRKHPRLQKLPVIALTPVAVHGDRERLLASGFDGYLSKPIKFRELTREVEFYLQRSA